MNTFTSHGRNFAHDPMTGDLLLDGHLYAQDVSTLDDAVTMANHDLAPSPTWWTAPDVLQMLQDRS